MLAALALPLAQAADSPRKIVWLGANTPARTGRFLSAFRAGLRAHGWIEGENIVVELLWAGGNYATLDVLAAQAVAMKPDVILAGTTLAALAAQRSTKDIPIVFAVPIDPIGAGLIASWARPGGNITGLSTISREIGPKRVQLIKDCVPALTRLAVLSNPTDQFNAEVLEMVRAAAAQLGIAVTVIDAATESDLQTISVTLSRLRAQAILVMDRPFFFQYHASIIAQVAAAGVPVIE